MSKEVHIAIRNDGTAGDGSIDNPYDGSTDTKLDDVLRDRSKIYRSSQALRE